MSIRQGKSKEGNERNIKKIRSERLKGGSCFQQESFQDSQREEKAAECASCGRKIKKKALWRKGKPYCSLECSEW